MSDESRMASLITHHSSLITGDSSHDSLPTLALPAAGTGPGIRWARPAGALAQGLLCGPPGSRTDWAGSAAPLHHGQLPLVCPPGADHLSRPRHLQGADRTG